MRRFLLLCCQACVLWAVEPARVEVPAGSELYVRLATKLDSAAAKSGDKVEAVVVAPLILAGQPVIPSGTLLRGKVKTVASTVGKVDKERAQVVLDMNELAPAAGKPVPVTVRLAGVDNARESVDETGRLQGILASETIGSRIDQGIRKLGQRASRLAGLLGAIKGSVLDEVNPEIVYSPGTEMKFVLTAPLKWTGGPGSVELQPIPDEAHLIELVTTQPFQTVAAKPPRPSDITNLMYIGSEQAVVAAFKAAGWTTADALSGESKLETFRAIAELRGYKEGPVSLLTLDGQAPDHVFQKTLNTFAMRHHLRVYRRPDTWKGQTVWVCSATHDTGIAFSEEDRTFIHSVDPEIDKERAKVVSDLLFTGLVKSLALVDRPDVPREGMNATGDKRLTDGRMAVVILN